MPNNQRYSIVITGSTGFIGKRVVKKIVKTIPKGKILFLAGPQKNQLEIDGLLALKQMGISVQIVDLVKPNTLKKLPKNPKLVIHLAANTHTEDPDHRVNDIGTINLINAIGPLNSKTHFIHISTTAFMTAKRDYSKPLTESSVVKPSNKYGRTKYLAELFVSKKCIEQGFKLTVLRLPTVYGSGMRPNSFFNALEKMARKKSILSRINWPGKTDLIHVDDVAKTIKWFTNHPPKPGIIDLYILSTEALTLRNVYKKIYKQLGMKYTAVVLPSIIWKFIGFFTIIVPFTEKVIPSNFYNWIWRSTLIINNVIWCDSSKIMDKMGSNWKPKKLVDTISQVI